MNTSRVGIEGFYPSMRRQSPGAWKGLAIFLIALNLLLGYLNGMARTGLASAATTYATGAALMWPALVLFALTRFQRFNNPRSSWKILFWMSLMATFVGLGRLGMDAVDEYKQISSVEFLTKIADKANELLPRVVDEGVELTNIAAAPAMLIYGHRLTDLTSDDIDPDAPLDELIDDVTQVACTTKEPRFLIDHGVTLRYSFRSRDEVEFIAIDVKRKDCNTK